MTQAKPQAQRADTQFFDWCGYRCAYEAYVADSSVTDSGNSSPDSLPLLLIHPIGVGLSRQFWHPFCDAWQEKGDRHPIYNSDLLGCGESDKPRAAYTPDDWADQLLHLVKTVIQRPVVVVVQGALFSVAIRMVQKTAGTPWIKGLVLAGPPGWSLVSQGAKLTQQKLLWNLLFDSPLGAAFYRYARRRKFLDSFSKRQLFASTSTVDEAWLVTLKAGAQDPATRHAVFSFLAGFWRKNYTEAIEQIQQPTLVLFGEEASGIDRASRLDSAQKRLQDYLHHLPQAQGALVPGRNVLPYESTSDFVAEVDRWLCTLV
ncbi:MAG: alpha/beta fold hydrolase [Elainellaceae cyanobacterium]